ncbi:MAG: Gfo/Idh/MocA family oxidoreductase [Anaerolineales bacterium]|nr:Gfo/Idh/MocA family oxidoreductase [Anaerolineales bacterium]
MTYRVIQVGTGKWGTWWCEKFLPPNIEDDLIEVVAAVDIDQDTLVVAKKYLDLPEGHCYTDPRKAFKENPADFCTIVTPPATHEFYVDLAIEHDMHILSEKPIADSLESSVRISEKVKRAGLKMGVTMSHRFDADKTTLREELRSGTHGNLNYIVSRFTCDCRKYGTWGDFRHEMDHPLLIEGAVHHLDIIADLSGAKCDTIYAQTWNTTWGEYAGDSHALVTMRFENGVKGFYEGANTNAIGLNGWSQEYIRTECDNATLILDHRRLEHFPYDPLETWVEEREGSGEVIPLIDQEKWTNTWLIEQFVHWLDGGEPMATNVEDNLQSMGMVFGAIESSKTGLAVKVQELLDETRESLSR